MITLPSSAFPAKEDAMRFFMFVACFVAAMSGVINITRVFIFSYTELDSHSRVSDFIAGILRFSFVGWGLWLLLR